MSEFARFGVPYSLVSDNAKEFTNGKITHWLEIQGWKKLQSRQYAPRSNGIAERAQQTVKKAWKPDLRVSFHSFLQRIILTHRNTTNAHGDTAALLIFGKSLRLPAVVDFEIGQPILDRATAERDNHRLDKSAERSDHTC